MADTNLKNLCIKFFNFKIIINCFQQVKHILLKIILFKQIVHMVYSFFGHTLDTILKVNLCSKESKITNKNKKRLKDT
jgi:hypothetical protein